MFVLYQRLQRRRRWRCRRWRSQRRWRCRRRRRRLLKNKHIATQFKLNRFAVNRIPLLKGFRNEAASDTFFRKHKKQPIPLFSGEKKSIPFRKLASGLQQGSKILTKNSYPLGAFLVKKSLLYQSPRAAPILWYQINTIYLRKCVIYADLYKFNECITVADTCFSFQITVLG